jgi:putative NADPH-quinone reductase
LKTLPALCHTGAVHVYVIYAHPAARSFSRETLAAFSKGLSDGGHTFETGDLYAMNFQSDLDAAQYQRETGGDPDAPQPADVAAEHSKIARADALAFIYPLWWSDCPAKLKGWFDRVWSYGYAYYYETPSSAIPAAIYKKPWSSARRGIRRNTSRKQASPPPCAASC